MHTTAVGAKAYRDVDQVVEEQQHNQDVPANASQ